MHVKRGLTEVNMDGSGWKKALSALLAGTAVAIILWQPLYWLIRHVRIEWIP